eukprot:gnl/MRDRNA2_/MRDRNA2_86695_c0_seq6.p1 gnl/MRDRNA2_/MRDRNA2_86695_c0~~gnl/MRDRNA2_/MRDRNA2_86695_c0_seq6.p1  ORF type:complete len:102 (+),score=1.32 gnl/MRDRNA2_/MRDRNA2_86695_c0_seq6:392-697(+)
MANTSWAVASIRLLHGPLMPSIAQASLAILTDFRTQSLASMAWSLARLLLTDEPFLDAIAAAALARRKSFDYLNISNMAWAFATLLIEHWVLLNRTFEMSA